MKEESNSNSKYALAVLLCVILCILTILVFCFINRYISNNTPDNNEIDTPTESDTLLSDIDESEVPSESETVATTESDTNAPSETDAPVTDVTFEETQDNVDKYINSVTLGEQHYLLEIYLTGIDTSREIVVGQIANCFYADTYYYSVFCLAYKDDPTTWIASWYEQDVSGTNSYSDRTIVKINEYDLSGIYGYAVLNLNALETGTRIYPEITINTVKATSINDNPIIKEHINNSIIDLNKDKESLIIQQSKTTPNLFGDNSKVLQFIHFSDIHGNIENWSRIVHYMRGYTDYIKFAVMTGDYCAGAHDTWTDLYSYADNGKIYNCVGNHDFITDSTTQTIAPQSDTYNKLFATSDRWEVNFPEGENLMYYHKDFTEYGIRLIVIDQFYWDDAEATWLTNILEEAQSKNLAVITASHWQSGTFENMLDCSFNTFDDYSPYGQPNVINTLFEPIIANFVKNGGEHIVHLSGHWHHDMTGVTKSGILNTVIECATIHGEPWKNTVRKLGTRTQDCFNIIGVDTTNKLLKIIRIGNNTDGYLQYKNVLCINYKTKTVITNY